MPRRAAARQLLEQHGYEVVGEAGDGDAALAAARELRPDVVLLDVQLPGRDGFEVAARLRAAGGAPAIVMVSSRDGEDFGSLIEQSGARGFIPKSPSQNNLKVLAADPRRLDPPDSSPMHASTTEIVRPQASTARPREPAPCSETDPKLDLSGPALDAVLT